MNLIIKNASLANSPDWWNNFQYLPQERVEKALDFVCDVVGYPKEKLRDVTLEFDPSAKLTWEGRATYADRSIHIIVNGNRNSRKKELGMKIVTCTRYEVLLASLGHEVGHQKNFHKYGKRDEEFSIKSEKKVLKKFRIFPLNFLLALWG